MVFFQLGIFSPFLLHFLTYNLSFTELLFRTLSLFFHLLDFSERASTVILNMCYGLARELVTRSSFSQVPVPTAYKANNFPASLFLHRSHASKIQTYQTQLLHSSQCPVNIPGYWFSHNASLSPLFKSVNSVSSC